MFRDISFLQLWQQFCSAEQKHLCNFGRECYEEQFCEIILDSGQWFRSRCSLKDFLSGALAACSVEWVHLCNFERGHDGEHSCEVI